MTATRAFARTDLRRLGRDPFLVLITSAPLLLVVVIRLARPPLDRLFAEAGIDAASYAPLAAAFLLLMVLPFLYGALIGLLLLDERDAGTLTVLRITPVSLTGYVRYRALLAAGLAGVSGLIALPASGLWGAPLVSALPAVGLAALLAPLPGLLLAAFAGNKVEGLAIVKAAGLPAFSPVAAWFLDAPWSHGFAVIPTYWPAAALVRAAEGAEVWPIATAGALFLLACWWLLARRLHGRLGGSTVASSRRTRSRTR